MKKKVGKYVLKPKKVLKLINKQKGGYFKSKIFFKVLNLAQTYLTFRENQRFYLDHPAASPGIFNGKARVVESIKELYHLEDNEILITSNTDPAWTAIFSKIGALITETGGILSHGAVISREYRIPAVTAVKGATNIFKTGEELIVDGNEGVVYKKE